MAITYLQAVILTCLQKINGERTVYSIFHMLTGKKSSQTIQDAHLFGLKTYFKTVPGLERRQFTEMINSLCRRGLIRSTDPEKQVFLLTEDAADEFMQFFDSKRPLEFIDGFHYQDTSLLFWKRLTLLVQIASHFAHRQSSYYPIQKDPEVINWAKSFLFNLRGEKSKLSEFLLLELETVLANDYPDHPDLIVRRFSGAGIIGLTTKQLTHLLEIEDDSEYHYRFLNGLHGLVQAITAKPGTYRILYALVEDIHQSVPFTKSTMRTYEMLKKGMAIEQIALMRKLKANTIEDHIIEIALGDPAFPIDRFVERKIAERIIATAERLGGRKLKPIKEELEGVTYFQIRLVLAKVGET